MTTPVTSPKTRDVPYYTPTLETIDDSTRSILENYSKIPPEEVIPHVLKIRDQAWEIYSYPCIGQFRFLNLSLGMAPQYPEVLQRVKDGQRLLDLGCCFGQDIRRLVADGAPSSNLYGSDLEQEFMDLGYDLFRDRSTLKAHFFSADIFAEDSVLAELYGTFDMIHASSFFHLFDWDRQVEVARAVVKLLRPVRGSLVLGRQVGSTEPGNHEGMSREQLMWRHDEGSWKKMWEQVGEETGTKWKVTFTWEDRADWFKSSNGHWQGDHVKPMRYAVWRE